MIYFTAHTFKCMCHCRSAMFRVLGMYNFAYRLYEYILDAWPKISISDFSKLWYVNLHVEIVNGNFFSNHSPKICAVAGCQNTRIVFPF